MVSVVALTSPSDSRVPLTIEVAKKIIDAGYQVTLPQGFGGAFYEADEDYKNVGCTLVKDILPSLKKAEIVLSTTVDDALFEKIIDVLPKGALWLGLLEPHQKKHRLEAWNKKHITALAWEFLPRISRAQSMDVLSSQANLLGYRAVIEAAFLYGRPLPLMMTASGTIPAARVLVVGAGVAGLQAIATAKRLGAVVSAFDVRPAVKEQVESLGARFVDTLPQGAGEGQGGYARALSDEEKKQQHEALKNVIPQQNIIVSTAQIPGQKAPLILTEDMMSRLKPGSVVVDLAASSGGNTAWTKDGKTLNIQGVTVMGENMMPRIANEARTLYARNIWQFFQMILKKDQKELQVPWEDEIIKGMLVTHQGQTHHASLSTQPSKTAQKAPKTSSSAKSEDKT